MKHQALPGMAEIVARQIEQRSTAIRDAKIGIWRAITTLERSSKTWHSTTFDADISAIQRAIVHYQKVSA